MCGAVCTLQSEERMRPLTQPAGIRARQAGFRAWGKARLKYGDKKIKIAKEQSGTSWESSPAGLGKDLYTLHPPADP